MKYEIESDCRSGSLVYWTYADGILIGPCHRTKSDAESYLDRYARDRSRPAERWEYKPETLDEYVERHTDVDSPRDGQDE